MYSRSTGEVNSNSVTSSLLRKQTQLPTHAHEVRVLTFEVTDNFGSNVVLPCGAYGPRWLSIHQSDDSDTCGGGDEIGIAMVSLRAEGGRGVGGRGCGKGRIGRVVSDMRMIVVVDSYQRWLRQKRKWWWGDQLPWEEVGRGGEGRREEGEGGCSKCGQCCARKCQCDQLMVLTDITVFETKLVIWREVTVR